MTWEPCEMGLEPPNPEGGGWVLRVGTPFLRAVPGAHAKLSGPSSVVAKKSPMKPAVNVAITGAAGQIGYALAFRVASGALLGLDTRVRLHLLEITAALPALQGVLMELNDCAFPTLESVSA